MTDVLLNWYAQSARTLPFRGSRDPYAIWVSEIMAQQTRITALLPYYQAFMTAFPTVGALAAATEDEVLALWAGLGYYARARNLYKAARSAMETGLPETYRGWRALPGVGDYTAAAVASIAFGEKVPAVDGNVLRVFARLFAREESVHTPEGKRAARAWVVSLMEQSEAWPGDITQALMELGALICVPQTPHCDSCPLADACRARRAGAENRLPLPPPPKQRRIERRDVLVILDNSGHVLLRRRTEKLLHNLYEFPAEAEGVSPLSVKELGQAVHIFTHIEWHMRGWLWRTDSQPPPDGMVWIPRRHLSRMAIPTAFRYYGKALENEEWEN